MNKKNIEFFTWIREIEFKKLKNYFLTYYNENFSKEEINLINQYLNINLNFKLNDDYKYSEFKEKIIDNFEKREKFKPIKNLGKINQKEIINQKVYDILQHINNHLIKFTKDNYNKIRKHKIIYFIFAHAINTNKKYGLWDSEESIESAFESDNKKFKKMSWCAFENGPILNSIYNPDGKSKDDDLYLKYKNNKQLIVFEMSYFFLKNFSTTRLIEESHNTKPWSENYKKNTYYSVIKNKEIINYFKENKPFFLDMLN